MRFERRQATRTQTTIAGGLVALGVACGDGPAHESTGTSSDTGSTTTAITTDTTSETSTDEGGQDCATGCFEPEEEVSLAAPLARGLVVGDFDGDARADIASGDGVVLFRDDGPVFTDVVDLQIPDDRIVRFAADTNGDGLDDLLGEDLSSTVLVFLSNGDRTFAEPVVTDLSSTAAPVGHDLFADDFDGDGLDDVAVLTDEGETLNVLLGAPDGQLAAIEAYSTGGMQYVLTGGHVDEDEHVDLVSVLGRDAMVWIGLGDGTFEGPVAFDAGAAGTGAPVRSPAEVGMRGVAYTGSFGVVEDMSAGVVALWAAGGEVTGAGFETGWATDAIAVGDFRGDGFGDAVASTHGAAPEPFMTLVCGRPPTQYEVCDTVTLAGIPSSMGALDLDDDGLEDAVYVDGSEPTRLHVLYSRPAG
jgi:hypothetical protein